MTSATVLVWEALRPALVGTAYEDDLTKPPSEPDDPEGGTQVLWCASTADFVRRHPDASAAVDGDHPDGCTDLVVDVDGRGRLDDAWMECLGLGDGLVGRPVADVLPVLVQRVRDLLH